MAPAESVRGVAPDACAAVAPPNVSLQLRLRAKIMEQLDSGAVAEMSPEILRAELEPVIHEIAGKERVQLSARDQFQLAQELTDDMVGFGPLEPLLRDDSISDIMVNGPDTVFIERRRQAAEIHRALPRCGACRHGGAEDGGDDRPARR